MKIGAVPINKDVERVRTVREAVGPDVRVMVDANNAYRHYQAIEFARKAEKYDLFWFEEPVEPDDYIGQREITRATGVPVAAGENEYTRYGFRQYIEQQILDILQPDVGLAGGISETKKIATYAETYNLHVQPHNCAGPVATAAAVQVDACIPNFIIQEWFPYRKPENYQLVKQALEPQVVEGYLPLPEAPGLGVELDDEVISQYSCLRIE